MHRGFVIIVVAHEEFREAKDKVIVDAEEYAPLKADIESEFIEFRRKERNKA